MTAADDGTPGFGIGGIIPSDYKGFNVPGRYHHEKVFCFFVERFDVRFAACGLRRQS
jgi:hypothetical protein